jgi:GT2 family glycosyltransferase
MKHTVSIVIVSFHSAGHIARCLRSVRGAGEVVVVDNASTDETCAVVTREAPGVKLIRNDRNRGFAAAVNQGIAATGNPFVLLLNPDAVLNNSLQPLVDQCLSPEVGAAGGKLVDGNGQSQAGFNVRTFPTPMALLFEILLVNRLWPRNPVNRRYRCLDADLEQLGDVDQPAGAFLMVRRDVLSQVQGLDESFYPIWFEDVDLCLRIRDAGYRIRYVPNCIARHAGGHSVNSVSVEERYLAWYGNLLRFNYKHFSKGIHRCLHIILLMGLRLRWFVCLAGAGTRAERKAYASVIKSLRGFSSRDRACAAGMESPSPLESKSS